MMNLKLETLNWNYSLIHYDYYSLGNIDVNCSFHDIQRGQIGFQIYYEQPSILLHGCLDSTDLERQSIN